MVKEIKCQYVHYCRLSKTHVLIAQDDDEAMLPERRISEPGNKFGPFNTVEL